MLKKKDVDVDLASLRTASRFNVVGSSGSGKTTVARSIAEALDLPFVEMDGLFWQPNWTETPDDEFLPGIAEVVAADAWVLDGNYSRTTMLKWRRAEVVVWLDIPYPVIVYQVIKRSLIRGIARTTLWAGNRESLWKSFFQRDSVIWWSLTNLRRVRSGYAAAMVDPRFAQIVFVRLRSRRAVQEFVRCLASDAAARSPA